MTGPDARTLALYEARAEEYAQRTLSEAPDEALAAFLGDMPAGGAVLDLGCGPGFAAARMAQAGLQVEATDAAAAMVALAARHPGVTARQESFDALDAQARYDGIWANFSLLHAPRANLPRHLAAMARALRPGGLVHVAMKRGEGTARDSLGRAYTYVTAPELEHLLLDAGLTTVRRRFSGEDPGFDGVPAPWIGMQAHG